MDGFTNVSDKIKMFGGGRRRQPQPLPGGRSEHLSSLVSTSKPVIDNTKQIPPVAELSKSPPLGQETPRTKLTESPKFPPALKPKPKITQKATAAIQILIQCDFCGHKNLTDAKECIKCSNPNSARWMKVPAQVCCTNINLKVLEAMDT